MYTTTNLILMYVYCCFAGVGTGISVKLILFYLFNFIVHASFEKFVEILP